ncbi:MAG: glycosyltransferase family 2 protein [Chloroflexota bacterium]
MQISVVIPVWNGKIVVLDCLEALFANSSDALKEVICVDNASADDSVTLIKEKFPQATLIANPVNAGFAGGVNLGIQASSGDLVVLLNQDCLVQAGWDEAFKTVLSQNSQVGIVGCTIFNGDGTLNHAGAKLEKPLALGQHFTEQSNNDPQMVEYVTGAVFGITRQTIETIGLLDEGFYPAYYEEVDYCYRARQNGLETMVVPQATAVHHFNNKEWQTDPVRHFGNQNSMRYRFIVKQYDVPLLSNFFEAEHSAILQEKYFEQAIGRVIGLRQTLQTIEAIFAKRLSDMGNAVTAVHKRHAVAGFTKLLHHAFSMAQTLSMPRSVEPPADDSAQWQAIHNRLTQLQKQEHQLLSQIYFRAPDDNSPESTLSRLFRLGVKRPLSFIIGRDYLLQSQLNTVHVARFDQMMRLQRLTERRLTLLEKLSKYEYR